MSIQDLGSLGELLAAIATLLTLVYLSIQIRQNTRAVKASSHHAVTDSFNHLNSIIGTDPKAARILRLGVDDLAHLDEDEVFSFSYLMLAYLRIFETLFYQHKNGTMERELFESEEKSIHNVLLGKGARQWWRTNELSLSDEFRAYVDRISDRAEQDSRSATRPQTSQIS